MIKGIRQFLLKKIEAGAYEYRGFYIWHDVTRNVWVVEGNRGAEVKKLRDAKKHIDRTIKFAKKV